MSRGVRAVGGGRRAITAGIRGTAPAAVVGEPFPELMTEIEGEGYPWPTGRFTAEPMPEAFRGGRPGVLVSVACRCGGSLMSDELPSSGAVMQGCGCELSEEATAAFDRVWAVAVALVSRAAVLRTW